MRTLYRKNTANYPRLSTDTMWVDYDNSVKCDGVIHETIKYIEEFQLLREDLWDRFVRQFKEEDADYENGWRGEYWGKMMRGACFVYSYSQNQKLYETLSHTVEDMLTAQEENGRISSYASNHEFDGWDIWCRKYVLLGMQYFLEICKDEKLAAQITKSLCGQVDYIISKIGRPEEGKKLITEATRHWGGLNSSSLLEPIVRLYAITKEQKYLDFASYIVECGGTSVENIFELAYEDERYPYQYPYTKAYEMISCFEGILEYYRVTGDEKYKTMVINFADKVLESDFTIIGSSGCTHELFDHSTVRQANTNNNEIAQETCVTVTLMKFFYQLTLLTGDSKYVDAFETSLYNAYLGAVNTEKVVEPSILREHPDWCIEAVPFDSYSPLTAGTRGKKMGGLMLMSDKHYYGCCACIGSVGAGLVSKMALLTTKQGFALNLFINGSVSTRTESGNKVSFRISADYPVMGSVKIAVEPEATERFTLMIRKPEWSRETAVSVKSTCGKADAEGQGCKHICTENNISADGHIAVVENEKGYLVIDRVWSAGDVVELELDMRTEAVYPIPYGQDCIRIDVDWANNSMTSSINEEDPLAKKHIALRRGPIVLAQENRLGYSVDEPVSILVQEDGYVDVTFPKEEIAPYKHILEMEVPLANGSKMHVTDYASAGKLWTEESKMAAWILTE